jgi:integrase/recombinase XerC
MDLTTAHTQFVEFLGSRRRAKATIIAYAKDIDQLKDFLGSINKKTIDEVVHDDLSAFLKKLGSDSYTPKSISRKINSIKTFFRFLKSSQVITSDPAVEIEHPKYEVKPPRILSKLEYRALRDACRGDIRTHAIVELFLQTGLRIGELANLTTEDVKDTELHIAAEEGHAERMVPLNKAGKEALTSYLNIRATNTTSNALFILKPEKPCLSVILELPLTGISEWQE